MIGIFQTHKNAQILEYSTYIPAGSPDPRIGIFCIYSMEYVWNKVFYIYSMEYAWNKIFCIYSMEYDWNIPNSQK